MRLQLMSWPEVERYLSTSQGVILPAGATEQHSPCGHIGTDAICAEALAVAVGEGEGAVVAPTVSYGMSEHHMAFAGSVTLRPSTLVSVVRDVVLSLARHGFRRIFVINGHGGNTPSLHAGFFEAYSAASNLIDDPGALRCTAVDWWDCDAAQRLSAELFGANDGDHATASETSISLSVYPDHIKAADLSDHIPESGSVYGPEDFRKRYPDGRMGSDPSLAGPELGLRLREAIVPDLSARYRSFLEER